MTVTTEITRPRTVSTMHQGGSFLAPALRGREVVVVMMAMVCGYVGREDTMVCGYVDCREDAMVCGNVEMWDYIAGC